mgnify:CR=1 FL=1
MDPRLSLYLHTLVAAVAPINGVSIGRWADKTTWRVDYRAEATQSQKDAAQMVIAAFDVNAPLPLSTLATTLDAATATPTLVTIKAVFQEWRKQVS